MSSLVILVLYRMGDPRGWRAAVRDLEFMLPDAAPEHEYVVHPAEVPLPDYVHDIPFDGIVMGPTFLCARHTPRLLESARRTLAFIAESDACKIALPQDDYSGCAVLESWMLAWGVDTLYTVCPSHWAVLYPGMAAAGRVKLGYTAYISEKWIARWREPKPLTARSIDVSYRARRLPPSFGRVGHLKGEIGARFERAAAGSGLTMDISVDEARVIPGAAWHDFLEESKFCLTAPSGSSVIDPEGRIQSRVKGYLALHPAADFDTVERHCFPGEDGRYVFTPISPRNMEAALAGTVQIATPGTYGGFFESGRDYLPLAADCSNIADVLAAMRDVDKVSAIAANCRAAMLGAPDLRLEARARMLVQQIAEHASARHAGRGPTDATRRLLARYRAESAALVDRHWRHGRVSARLRSVMVDLGARRVARIASYLCARD